MSSFWTNFLASFIGAIPAWLAGLWCGLKARGRKRCGCKHALAFHDLAASSCKAERRVSIEGTWKMRPCPCAHFTGSVTA